MTQSVISWIPAVAAGLIYLAVGTRVVRGMSGSQTPEALKALRWPALGAALLHLVAVGMEMFGPGVISGSGLRCRSRCFWRWRLRLSRAG